METFELLEVTADIGIECKGSTIKELFNAALSGLYYIVYDLLLDYNILKYRANKVLNTSSKEIEDILFSILDEAIYNIYQKRELIKIDEIKLESNFIKYTTYYCNFKIENEVKAVTLHNFKVEWLEYNKLWQATIIFDV